MVDVNPETDNSQIEGGDVNYSEQLTKITDSINNLSDQTKDNDEKAKEELQKILNGEFINNLKGYLDKNPTELANLQNSLISILNSYPGDKENDEAYTSLKNLATTIGLQKNDGKWSKEYQETADNVPKKPTLNLTGELTGIKSEESDKKQTGNDGLVGLNRDAPEGEETLPNDENLYRTIQTIDTQLGEVEALLENDKLSNDNTLKKTQDGLKTAKTVIDYTTIDNVKILQNFISENLTGQDKADFDSASKKRDSFDGKFGKGTLKGVNIILKKTDEYISGMKNYLNTIQKQEIEKINDPTDIKNIEKGRNITAESLLQINNITLPDGASVNFAEGEVAKLNGSGNQDIKLEIKLGEETVKTITVKVNVEESIRKPTEHTGKSTESTDSSKSSEPLQLINNDGEQKTYLVMRNSSNLATRTGFAGATFYSVEAYTGDHKEGQQWGMAEQQDSEIDKEYYAQLDNSGNIYKIKLDKNGYLCPTAQNAISGVSVVFQDHPSCRGYLMNKLPNHLKNVGEIGWNGSDYYISRQSYPNYLTIEPMTIDGKWVCNDLTKCLALLDFTNYLKNNKKVYDIDFINDNPNLKLEGNDLYVRVKRKSNVIYNGEKVERNGKRLPVNKSQFGLDGISTGNLTKFIKYNNHEDWSDDWDKKKPNRYYRPVKLS